MMEVITDDLLDLPHVRHGFFTRKGGVSKGIYGSLNCGPGSGDSIYSVIKNRGRVCDVLETTVLATAYQIHSADVKVVSDPWNIGEDPKCDAFVTDRKDVALGILTADCAPVLFACKNTPVIGAAHAGWGGALKGVLENTVDEMENLGAARKDIIAVIGPCIGPESYEVTKEFLDRFLEADEASQSFFIQKDETHWLFNLPLFCLKRLEKAGLEKVEYIGMDTYADADRFFSYRRSCHKGEADYGRQISAIALV